MDAFLRGIAIFVEVVMLAGIMYSLLTGVRLILSDLGFGPKYRRVLVMFLAAAGVLSVVFFIVHLITFYPTV